MEDMLNIFFREITATIPITPSITFVGRSVIMIKRFLATAVLLGLLAMPTFADTVVKSYQYTGKTIVITITYTDSNGNGRIDTLQELRSITNIQVNII